MNICIRIKKYKHYFFVYRNVLFIKKIFEKIVTVYALKKIKGTKGFKNFTIQAVYSFKTLCNL